MARFQIGDTLQPGDNRVKGIAKELASVGSSKFAKDFHDKYSAAYHLPPMVVREPLPRASQGPSEALRSQETETETEQEHTTSSPDGDPPSPPPLTSSNGHHLLTVQELVDLYNQIAPAELARVTRLSEGRKRKAKAYLAAFPDREFWMCAFTELQASSLLRGLRPSPGHEGFRGDFDWLLTKGRNGTENVVKVAEGRFRDHRAAAEDDDDDAA